MFVRHGQSWSEQQKLVRPDPSVTGYDGFGRSVALSDDGTTAIDDSAVAVVLSVTLAEISPEVAVKVALPTLTAVATPALVTETTAGLSDAQPGPGGVAVLPSEKLPAVDRVTDAPSGIGGRFAGTTTMF